MSRLRTVGTTVAAAAIAATATGTGASAANADAPRLEPPTAAFLAVPAARPFDSAGTPRTRSLVRIRWGAVRSAAGDTVNVKVSPAYGSDPTLVQQWVDFFAALPHGQELALLRVYIAPLDEVEDVCGDDALGCYWANRLVMVGDSSGGVPPASVAAHEYGHHVAYNRLNPPWRAVDWGTKRWASHMNVCARAEAGTAFPGDEDSDYALNPGEAFAESYRVLTETEKGMPLTWPILDPTFIPDAAALQAVRDDVLQPWAGPATKTVRVRFAPNRRVWTQTVVTQLDGELSARVGASTDLQLLGSGRNLAPVTWTPDGGKAVRYQVCGRRSVEVRVTRHGRARALPLRLSIP